MHSEDVRSHVLRGGAAGYITKDSAPQELATAVRKVANGGKYVSASLAEILASECSSDPQKALHEKLSDREYRVMWLLATGKQISEIAKEMGLSPSTVSTYRTRILRKLGLTSNAALVHYAIATSWSGERRSAISRPARGAALRGRADPGEFCSSTTSRRACSRYRSCSPPSART